MKLSASDLHIWHISLDNQTLIKHALSALPSTEETARTAQLTHPKQQQCYVKTRWAMRNILGHYLRIMPAEVQLRRTKLGKPELTPRAHALDLRFNLSHSGNRALLAVTRKTEVGIDLMEINQQPRPLALAKRYFTEETVAELKKLPEIERQNALLRLWTQYEAYKKAQGVGLRGGDQLLPLTIDLPTDKFQTLPTTANDISPWLVTQINPAVGYVGAVVIANNTALQIRHIDYDISATKQDRLGSFTNK
jgi:4'-phosphopantetheinyl transferase